MPSKLSSVRVALSRVAHPVLWFLGMLLCLLVPRNRNLWVFAADLPAADRTALLQALAQQLPHHRAVVLTWGRDETAAAQPAATQQVAAAAQPWDVGQPQRTVPQRTVPQRTVPQRSLAGFWACLRAAQICVHTGAAQLPRYSSFGSQLVQIDATLQRVKYRAVTPPQDGLGAALRRFFRPEIRLYTVSSEQHAQQVRAHTKALPGQVVVTGAPRLDAAALSDPHSARQQLRQDFAADATVPLVLCDTDTALSQSADAALCAALQAKQSVTVLRRAELGADLYRLLAGCDLVLTGDLELAADAARLGVLPVWIGAATAAPELFAVVASQPPAQLAAAVWQLLDNGSTSQQLRRTALLFAQRQRQLPDGFAAQRTITAVQQLDAPQPPAAQVLLVQCEQQQNLDLTALAADIAATGQLAAAAETAVLWAVSSEAAQVPVGAQKMLIGAPGWQQVCRSAQEIYFAQPLVHAAAAGLSAAGLSAAGLSAAGLSPATVLPRLSRKQRLIMLPAPLPLPTMLPSALSAPPPAPLPSALPSPLPAALPPRFDRVSALLVPQLDGSGLGRNPIVRQVARQVHTVSQAATLLDLRCQAEAELPAVPGWQMFTAVGDRLLLDAATLELLSAADAVLADTLTEQVLAALMLQLPVLWLGAADAAPGVVVVAAAQLPEILSGALTLLTAHSSTPQLRDAHAPLLDALAAGKSAAALRHSVTAKTR